MLTATGHVNLMVSYGLGFLSVRLWEFKITEILKADKLEPKERPISETTIFL